MPLVEGARINDKYEVLKVINSGGMSTVYIVLDNELNKNWAMKEIVKKETLMGRVEYKSLITEINILKELSHEYLPRIVNILEDDSRIFVIMDYIEGKTLQDVVSGEKGGLPEDKVVKWAKQLTIALGYLHSRKTPIIYRDMKPANVMLQPDGNIKVFDFGASREYEGKESWKTQPLGTKGYAAPERYRNSDGFARFDVKSDIFELGMTIYHLLTGHDPARSPELLKPVSEWNPNVNKGLEKVITKMTRTNPADRHNSMEEVLSDLNDYRHLDTNLKGKVIKRLKLLTTGLAASVLLLLGSGLLFHANTAVADSEFNSMIEEAVKTQDADKLVQATQLKRESIKPYEVLIDLYTSDRVLDETESIELSSVLNANMSELRKSDDFSNLAVLLAETYYFGSTDETNYFDKASSWVSEYESTKDGGEDEKMSLLTDVIKANREGDMETLWGKLKEVVNSGDWSTQSKLSSLDKMYDLAHDKGLVSQLGQDSMFDDLQSMDSYLDNLNPNTETLSAMKDEVLAKRSKALDSLN